MTTGTIIFFTWITGFLTGYATYHACRVGYKALMQELSEAREEREKDPESSNSQGR